MKTSSKTASAAVRGGGDCVLNAIERLRCEVRRIDSMLDALAESYAASGRGWLASCSNAVDDAPNRRIAAIRKERGLSQANLAMLAGMTPSQLCRIELGRNGLSARTIRRLADALGVAVSDIVK